MIIENVESGLYWSSYVWSFFSPDAKAGFTVIGVPMNNLEIFALVKNSDHTVWFYDYPTSARKRIHELFQENDAWLRKDGGLTDADWAPLLEKRKSLYETWKKIVDNEPEKLWREDIARKTTWFERFEELYEKWKSAKTNKEKTNYWRLAGREIIGQEIFQNWYLNLSKKSKEAYRWIFRAINRPFSEAVKIAHYALRLMQDRYYMVPVYLAKAQWVQNPKLEGLILYKFSWGPGFFNFKYLNLKD